MRKGLDEKKVNKDRRNGNCLFCIDIDMGFTILIILEFFDCVLYGLSFGTSMADGGG